MILPSENINSLPGNDLFEKGKKLASRLPKISNKEIRVDENGRYFGNQFFMIFVGLKREKNKTLDALSEIYVERVKRLPQWKKFTEDNAALLDEIEKVIEDHEILNNLMNIRRRIQQIYKQEDVKKFNQQINFKEIEIAIARKLNPLLRQTAEAMIQADMNPRPFYN